MAADYFDYVLDGPPAVDTTDWADVVEFLDRSRERQKDRLEAELAQIEQELADRDHIHEDLVAELEGKIDRYRDRLDHLYTIGKGRTDGTRDHLKDRIAAFSRELREEQRSHWRDRQDLAQERRDVLRELEDVQGETLSEFL